MSALTATAPKMRPSTITGAAVLLHFVRGP
jgi:hypothetical protein